MKNILIIVSNFSVNYKDPGFFTRNYVDNLARLDNKLFVLAPHEYKSKFLEIMDNYLVYRFPYFLPFKYQKLAYGSGLAYNIKKYFLAKCQTIPFLFMELLYALYIIKKHNIHLINTHWLLPQGLIGAIISKLFRIKHVGILHSSEVNIFKKNFITRVIARFICKNTDIIVSVSKHRAKELFDILPEGIKEDIINKTHYIPMGIDIKYNNEYTEKIDRRYFNVLFVGRLVEVKGCKYLIDGFNHALKNNNTDKELMLNIVGYGNQEEALKAQVQKLGIKNNVIFHGKVKNNEIHKFYNSSDVLVLPSIVDDTGYQEGFPVVLLEAMAAGLPIIATDIAGVKEIINHGKNGFIVKQKDHNEISKGILTLINDTDMRNKFSNNCLKERMKYSWHNIANKYNDIFNGS